MAITGLLQGVARGLPYLKNYSVPLTFFSGYSSPLRCRFSNLILISRCTHHVGLPVFPKTVVLTSQYGTLRRKPPEYGQWVQEFSVYQCLLRESSLHSESDVDYIEKELAAENRLSREQNKLVASDPRNSMVNVGKLAPHKIFELQDKDGLSLGIMNRSQAVAMSQEKKLKLVLLNPTAKPWPLYKLMSGQELHQEQMRRSKKLKKKTSPTRVKELKASWNIGQHDIAVRRRQLENWFSDESSNIHVRVTVTGGKGNAIVSQEKQMEVVRALMLGLEDRLILNGSPRMMGKDQGTLAVTIRTMSTKEKAAFKKSLNDKTLLKT